MHACMHACMYTTPENNLRDSGEILQQDIKSKLEQVRSDETEEKTTPDPFQGIVTQANKLASFSCHLSCCLVYKFHHIQDFVTRFFLSVPFPELEIIYLPVTEYQFHSSQVRRFAIKSPHSYPSSYTSLFFNNNIHLVFLDPLSLVFRYH